MPFRLPGDLDQCPRAPFHLISSKPSQLPLCPLSTVASTLAGTSVEVFLLTITASVAKEVGFVTNRREGNASGDRQNMLCPLLSKAQHPTPPPPTSYFRGIMSPVPWGALLHKSGCPDDNRWMWMHSTGGTRSALTPLTASSIKLILTELFISMASVIFISIFSKQCLSSQTGCTTLIHSDIYLTTLCQWLYLCYVTSGLKPNKIEKGQSDKAGVFSGGGSELCRPAAQQMGPENGQKRRKGEFAGALMCPTHSCMHTYAWGLTFIHTHKCTFMHSSNLRSLGLSAHVCGLIRASSDRKQGVSQGETFVMEIWTAGVGKQSWGQDAPEMT